MIKILDCKSKSYKKKLIDFLEVRRSRKSIDTKKVVEILNDIKINKLKAVLKYEKRFSKNSKLYASRNEINKSVKKLDPKIKKAIDFAYSRIFKFHSLQKPNQESGITGGLPKMIETIARAGVVNEVDGLFIETHFDPENALSDGKNMLPIKSLEQILSRLISIRKTINSFKS